MAWYYHNQYDEKIGPLSSASLKKLAQQGVITPETTIEDATGRTALAKNVKGFTFPELTECPERKGRVNLSADVETKFDIALASLSSVITLGTSVKYQTPLQKAAGLNAIGEINRLIKAGHDVNEWGSSKRTPLYCAAQNNAVEAVVALLYAGASINGYADEQSPLYVAAQNNAYDVLGVLLAAGARIFYKNRSQTPLHLAAQNNAVDVIKILVSGRATSEARGGIDAKDPNNNTPLHIAIDQGNSIIVDYLIAAGADVNAKDRMYKGDVPSPPPLHIAIDKGNSMIVDSLIKAGADINTKNSRGLMPLHAASAKNTLEVVKILIKAGASVITQDGNSPLYAAAAQNTAEVVKVLVKAGADVHTKERLGDTPLHAAAQNTAEVANVLIKAGADINAKNAQGDTPLHAAAAQNTAEVVNVLIKAGADVNVQNAQGDTPLHYAATKNAVEVANVLIKAGADVNAKNSLGNTPLHRATENSAAEMADTLIKAKANISTTNKNGKTPLYFAFYHNCHAIITLILELLGLQEESMSVISEKYSKVASLVSKRQSLKNDKRHLEKSLNDSSTDQKGCMGGIVIVMLLGYVVLRAIAATTTGDDVALFQNILSAYLVLLLPISGIWLLLYLGVIKQIFFTDKIQSLDTELSSVNSRLDQLDKDLTWYDHASAEEKHHFVMIRHAVEAQRAAEAAKQKTASDMHAAEMYRREKQCPKCGKEGALTKQSVTENTRNEFRTEIQKERVRVRDGNGYREQAVPVQRQTVITAYREVTTCRYCNYESKGHIQEHYREVG